MSTDLRTIVAIVVLAMAGFVTVLAFFIPDKAFFIAAAGGWTAGLGVLVGYYFGSSHKPATPPQGDRP